MEGLWRIYGGFMEDLRRIYGGFIVDLWTRAESVYFHHRTKQAQPSPKPKAEAEPKNPKEVSRELSVVRWPALLVQEEDSWTTVSQCFSDLFQDVHQDVSNSLYFHSFTRCPWIQNKISGVALFFRLLAEYAEWKEGAILPDITVLQFDLPPPSFDMTWS